MVARRVEAGANEDRRFAASSVSGYRFGFVHGNAITGDLSNGAGSSNPAHIGLFEIPVPAGSYTLEVEGIHEEFVEGSSVGPGLFIIALPGTAPPPSAAIAVAAGELEVGHDVTLIGTAPRFDEFETAPLSVRGRTRRSRDGGAGGDPARGLRRWWRRRRQRADSAQHLVDERR